MSVPFMPKVARKAIEILTEPEYAQAHHRLVSEALYERIPDQHPLLIDEHLDYTAQLIEAAKRLAEQIQSGKLSRADAVARLETSFSDFETESITRALAFALQA
jgi:hypothetical protein